MLLWFMSVAIEMRGGCVAESVFSMTIDDETIDDVSFLKETRMRWLWIHVGVVR